MDSMHIDKIRLSFFTVVRNRYRIYRLVLSFLLFGYFVFPAFSTDEEVGRLVPRLTVMAPMWTSPMGAHFKSQMLAVHRVPPVPFFHVYDIVTGGNEVDKYRGTVLEETVARRSSEGRLVVVGPQSEFRQSDNPQHPRVAELEVLTLPEFEDRFGKIHLASWINYFEEVERYGKPSTGSVRLAGEVIFHFKTVDQGGKEIIILVLDSIPYDNHETARAYDTNGRRFSLMHRGTHRLIRDKIGIERSGGVSYHIQRIDLFKLQRAGLGLDDSDFASLNQHALNQIPTTFVSNPFTISDMELFSLMSMGYGDNISYQARQHYQGIVNWVKSWPARFANKTLRPRDQAIHYFPVWWKLLFVGGGAYFWAAQASDIASAGAMGAGLFAGSEAVISMLYTTSFRAFLSKPNTVVYTYLSSFVRSVLYGFAIKSIQYQDFELAFQDPNLLWHIVSHSLIVTAAKFYFTRLNKEMQEVALSGGRHEVNRVFNNSADSINRVIDRLPRFMHGFKVPDDAIRRGTTRLVVYEIFYDILKQIDLLLADTAGGVWGYLPRAIFIGTGIAWAYSYYALKLLTDPNGLESRIGSSTRLSQLHWMALSNMHRVMAYFFKDVIYNDLIMKSGRSALQLVAPRLAGVSCSNHKDLPPKP